MFVLLAQPKVGYLDNFKGVIKSYKTKIES
jgi:hypothetical protein